MSEGLNCRISDRPTLSDEGLLQPRTKGQPHLGTAVPCHPVLVEKV